MNEESSWLFLEQFLAGELSAADFERWFQTTPGLEAALGARAYHDLESFDPHHPNAGEELPRLVRSIYEYSRPGRLARDRAFRIARGLVNGNLPIEDGVRALAALCMDGHEWVPGTFVRVQWEFDKIPRPEQYDQWEPVALAAKLDESRQMTRLHRPAILDAAREIIAAYQKDYGAGGA